MGDEEPQHRNLSPESLNGSPVRLILTVADPHAAFARALAAGATPVCSVKEDNGWLVGRITDPFGHQWEIARAL